MNQLFDQQAEEYGPVECLGQTFPSDKARREHFLKLLAEKLQDPEFRKQEGFPVGTDEAILEMSNPPYYTACPNPWLKDFIEQYGSAYDPSAKYSGEPLAIDVSVGKTDAIYRAHSYHTKVPHLAIVPSILHYTRPGDVVLDGFSGSGMTGVAAQWCGTAPSDYRHELEINWKKQGKPAPKWGARKAILNDLSPAATYIGANYNIPFDVEAFAKAGQDLLRQLDEEIGWMYETIHSDGKTTARIDYTVWSEVLNCPECAGEIIFTTAALDEKTKSVADVLTCPHCGAEGKKEKMDLLFETFVDPATGQMEKRPKRVPALISYKLGKTTYTKKPDEKDLEKVAKIASLPTPEDLPLDSFPDCQMTRVGRMKTTNTTAIHHLFLPRAAQAMARLWRKAKSHPDPRTRGMLLFLVEQAIWGMSVLNRYKTIMHGRTESSNVNQYLSGVYYVPSHTSEVSPWYNLSNRLKRLAKVFTAYKTSSEFGMVTCGSAASIPIPDGSIDYIFTDPPFGENIYYSDLNFLVESWHGVKTDPNPEAIVDRVRKKGIPEYQHLMYSCFAEYYRVLKPGRWMTVVFSNSKAAVWNTIQVALQQTGFVVAEVTALDKKQGSFQQVMSPNTVKQDLVISVYKPNGGLEERLEQNGATPESAWDFVETHLRNLSVVKASNGQIEFIVERDPRRIFDRMVAWFVRHNVPVPLSNDEFLSGIRSRFPERDGMVFLTEQVAEYDKKRAQVYEAPQLELFVSDERSAIDWLTDFLRKRPSTYQETHPEFTTQVGAGWKKHEAKPELKALLEDNFLKYDGNGEVPSQIHSYLSTNHKDLRGLDKDDPRLIAKAKDRWYVPDPNKAQDLEKKREKALLKEFETYKSFSGRKIKESRLEVLRAGFRNAWANKDYETIIKMAGKLPDATLQEDEKLLTFYDMAVTRVEGDL
ncbi:DNA methylase [Tamilnaduibacter salinus]|uniref:DNA methylase n=1 Tax=Tamilnaduibacter salinus TaxID=1484056 RepID=A0A2A2I499_9GAMM|nr:DNA methyltransferase [Tamilnaduibacter salinus]PAV26559.1 DNA methylase [Tamilnaduibacter salinus]